MCTKGNCHPYWLTMSALLTARRLIIQDASKHCHPYWLTTSALLTARRLITQDAPKHCHPHWLTMSALLTARRLIIQDKSLNKSQFNMWEFGLGPHTTHRSLTSGGLALGLIQQIAV